MLNDYYVVDRIENEWVLLAHQDNGSVIDVNIEEFWPTIPSEGDAFERRNGCWEKVDIHDKKAEEMNILFNILLRSSRSSTTPMTSPSTETATT